MYKIASALTFAGLLVLTSLVAFPVEATEACEGLTFNDNSGRLGVCLPEGETFILVNNREGGRTLLVVKKRGDKISADESHTEDIQISKGVGGFSVSGEWKKK